MEDCATPPVTAGVSPFSTAPGVRRAVIDVGTNSVKLLVADVANGMVQPLQERSEQTRLGRGFYETHRLQPEAIQQTAEAVAKFAKLAASLNAVSTRVIATSAAREAVNQAELLAAIERAAGLPAEIISGETEAAWTFRGVKTNPLFANGSLLIIDIGGGSTEFIFGQNTTCHFAQSFPIGSVRLIEFIPESDPPAETARVDLLAWLDRFFRREVEPKLAAQLKTIPASEVRLVSTGGTSTILARMRAGLVEFERTKIEDVRLDREHVRAEASRLWRLPLAERKKIIGLPPNRADVILTGVAIHLAIMERFNFTEASVSTRGLRFAALLDAPTAS